MTEESSVMTVVMVVVFAALASGLFMLACPNGTAFIP